VTTIPVYHAVEQEKGILGETRVTASSRERQGKRNDVQPRNGQAPRGRTAQEDGSRIRGERYGKESYLQQEGCIPESKGRSLGTFLGTPEILVTGQGGRNSIPALKWEGEVALSMRTKVTDQEV